MLTAKCTTEVIHSHRVPKTIMPFSGVKGKKEINLKRNVKCAKNVAVKQSPDTLARKATVMEPRLKLDYSRVRD